MQDVVVAEEDASEDSFGAVLIVIFTTTAMVEDTTLGCLVTFLVGLNNQVHIIRE